MAAEIPIYLHLFVNINLKATSLTPDNARDLMPSDNKATPWNLDVFTLLREFFFILYLETFILLFEILWGWDPRSPLHGLKCHLDFEPPQEDFFHELWRKLNVLKVWYKQNKRCAKEQTRWHWWRHEILAWTSGLTFSSASSTSQCDISMTPVLSQPAADCSEQTDGWHWRTQQQEHNTTDPHAYSPPYFRCCIYVYYV